MQLKSNGAVDYYTTIQGAIDAAGSNDSIFIPDGVWYESIQFDATGISNVYIGGESKENTVISATDPLFLQTDQNTWQSIGGGVYVCHYQANIPSSDFLFVADENDSLLFTYSNWDGFINYYAGRGVYYNQNLDSLYIRIDENPNDIPIKVSSSISPFYLKNSQSWTLENFSLEMGARAGLFIRENTVDLTVKDLAIKNNRFGILAWGNGNDWDVSNLHVKNYHSPRWSWYEIKHPPYGGSKTMETAGVKINVVTNLNFYDSEISGFFDGFNLANANSFLDVNLKLHDNKVHNIFDDALSFEGYGKGVEIYGNSIYNSFVGISFFPFQGASEKPVSIYRNKIVNNKLVLWQDSLGLEEFIHGNTLKMGETSNGELAHLHLYHNSLIGYTGIVKLLSSSLGLWENCSFINNIFYAYDKAPIYDTGLADDFNFFDGNLYYRETPGSIIKKWNSASLSWYQTLDDAKTSPEGISAGWENSGLDVNPEFISADLSPNNEVEPLLTVDLSSPIINTGIDLPSGFNDCVSINDNEPDIGHIEYSSLGIVNEQANIDNAVEWKKNENGVLFKLSDYSGELTLYLVDIIGKKVNSKTFHYTPDTWEVFQTTFLQPGYYVLVLMQDGIILDNYQFVQ